MDTGQLPFSLQGGNSYVEVQKSAGGALPALQTGDAGGAEGQPVGYRCPMASRTSSS